MSKRYTLTLRGLTYTNLMHFVALLDNGYGDGEFFEDEDGQEHPDDTKPAGREHKAFLAKVYEPAVEALGRARRDFDAALAAKPEAKP